MRYVLVLALFCGCLWAATAAAEPPLTKRNNDATLRKPHVPGPALQRSKGPRHAPRRQESKPQN